MTKHLVDIDDDLLTTARAEPGTSTVNDTVMEALRRVAAARSRRVSAALDVLSGMEHVDSSEAWR